MSVSFILLTTFLILCAGCMSQVYPTYFCWLGHFIVRADEEDGFGQCAVGVGFAFHAPAVAVINKGGGNGTAFVHLCQAVFGVVGEDE